VIATGSAFAPDDLATNDHLLDRRVGGYAADAVIVIGSAFAPDDLAANDHRVGGEARGRPGQPYVDTPRLHSGPTFIPIFYV